MKSFDGLELPPRKAEYLKCLRECGDCVKIGELARNFDLDPSTVSRTVQHLCALELVEHSRYGSVALTDQGREYADFLLRRHRILGLILSHYGLSGEEACREASRCEYFISRDAVNKMCRSLGHPTMGICGTISHDAVCGGYTSGE